MNKVAKHIRVTEAQYCNLKEEYRLSGIIFFIDEDSQDYSSMADLENAIKEYQKELQ